MEVTENLRSGEASLDIVCGLAKSDSGAAAINQFHTSMVRVSELITAPRTTTLAGFPNIFWSDVKEYE
ncbi:MAG: hypothetical protein ACRDPW_08220, partial [Mycobacteriales bacterium]